MKLLFALPGFHRYDRGAEVALLAVAQELGRSGDGVTVVGSGEPRVGTSYDFEHVSSVRRETFEKWPNFPPFRSETAWEDATFAANLLRRYRPTDFDAAVTCSFPFTHWALRRPGLRQPKQIFVTQNGDWPAYSRQSEYRTFSCDGLVCTNPDYYDRNRDNHACALIPNGIDLDRFQPGPAERERLSLPLDRPIVLMVSAFIETKRVEDGIRAVAELDNAVLVVAGDGPLRGSAERLAEEILPGRFQRVSLSSAEMPSLYRSADAFLHMSLLESFGNVFLEAWACGLPVVAHDTPRLRWILGDHTDFLCDTQDRSTLAAIVSRALTRGRITQGQPTGIARFAWSNVAAQYRTFLTDLTAA